MAKCKNCKNLWNVYNTEEKEYYKWCPEKEDCMDTELERTCDRYIAGTNADRIRAISDEELADFLYKFNDIDEQVGFCTNKKSCIDWLEKEDTIPEKWCKECLLNWLKSEVGCE